MCLLFFPVCLGVFSKEWDILSLPVSQSPFLNELKKKKKATLKIHFIQFEMIHPNGHFLCRFTRWKELLIKILFTWLMYFDIVNYQYLLFLHLFLFSWPFRCRTLTAIVELDEYVQRFYYFWSCSTSEYLKCVRKKIVSKANGLGSLN